jgi:DNA-binding NarL/FixJ family response regulator
MTKIKLLIADDHAVVRGGIRNLLEDEPNIDIVGEAADGIEALDQIKALKPNLVLLDLTMPKMTGFEVAKIVSERYKNVKVIVFSMHNNQEYMVQAVENGAMGYLLKDTAKEEILRALVTVHSGQKYFPIGVSTLIIEGLLAERKGLLSQTKSPNNAVAMLSKQEKVVLSYIIEGLNSQDISDKLKLSIRTVSNHRANILRKTKVSSRYIQICYFIVKSTI